MHPKCRASDDRLTQVTVIVIIGTVEHLKDPKEKNPAEVT